MAESYYAWQVREADGRWGIARMEYRPGSPTAPILTMDVLVHRDREVAEGPMRKMAEDYKRMALKPMRLVRMEIVEVLEVDTRGAAHG